MSDDILARGISSDRAITNCFDYHINKRRHSLDEEQMHSLLERLRHDINESIQFDDDENRHRHSALTSHLEC